MNRLRTPGFIQFKRRVSVEFPTPGGASTAEWIQSPPGLAFHFQAKLYCLILAPAVRWHLSMGVGMSHSSRIPRSCDGPSLCCGGRAVFSLHLEFQSLFSNHKSSFSHVSWRKPSVETLGPWWWADVLLPSWWGLSILSWWNYWSISFPTLQTKDRSGFCKAHVPELFP